MAIADATRTRAELIAENAMLRQQLIIATRNPKRRWTITRWDRALLVTLSSIAKHWRNALLIAKPETLLSWHRQGFKLLWRWRTRHRVRSTSSALIDETIALIKQLRNATPWCSGPRFLVRDRDDKFNASFDAVAKACCTRVLKAPVRAPKANAFCERFIGSVRRECLDHVFILSEEQMRARLGEYLRYYNAARPHQGNEQRVPEGSAQVGTGRVIALPVLGGLHHEYRRAAA